VFLTGQTSKTVSVPVLGKSAPESLQYYYLNLNSVTGPASALTLPGVGEIEDSVSSGILMVGNDQSLIRGVPGASGP
jgi:hypothetical protein